MFNLSRCALVLVILGAWSGHVVAADDASPQFLDLSLEDLLKTEVTTAARKPQSVQATAAAVFVITREDIQRAGVTSIPDALAMAPGVEVARETNNHWAVSVRGFNNRFATKLLVLVDGRSIYSPLFSGVIWEDEGTLLEDIDRIEVIRGPGASLWGANAVNGVINIITRRSRETQGDLVQVGGGSEDQGFVAARHGGRAGDGYYRTWAEASTVGPSVNTADQAGNDYQRSGRAGFRGDWPKTSGNSLTVEGEVFRSVDGDRWNVPTLDSPQGFVTTHLRQRGEGGDLLARQEWALDDGSQVSLQGWAGATDLTIGDMLNERRTTVDVDFQHHLRPTARNDLIWGLGYRGSWDHIDTSGMIQFTPTRGDFLLESAFVQDEIALVPGSLHLVLGSRIEENNLTGFDQQPNARLAWTPTQDQTVWAAVSRAVRIPSRAEIDAQIDGSVIPAQPPQQPAVLLRDSPGGALVPERVTAFEVGYRLEPSPRLALDLTAFVNRYKDLLGGIAHDPQFVLAATPYVVQPFTTVNNVAGHTGGFELAIDWHPTSWWRIQPSYSYLALRTAASVPDQAAMSSAASYNGASPRNLLSVRSLMTLWHRHKLDLWVRYVSALPNIDGSGTRIPSYTTADLRYAWQATSQFERALVGRNLLRRPHLEFHDIYLPSETTYVERSVYANATWRF